MEFGAERWKLGTFFRWWDEKHRTFINANASATRLFWDVTESESESSPTVRVDIARLGQSGSAAAADLLPGQQRNQQNKSEEGELEGEGAVTESIEIFFVAKMMLEYGVLSAVLGPFHTDANYSREQFARTFA